jgi:hypothetical protein
MLARQYFIGPHVWASLVCLVDLVCFVYLVHLVYPVSLVQPNKQDKPHEQDRLADLFSILLERLLRAVQGAGVACVYEEADGHRRRVRRVDQGHVYPSVCLV